MQGLPSNLIGLLHPWLELAQEVDRCFADVAARHPGQVRCAPGCGVCCWRDLRVLVVEAVALLHGMEQLGLAPPPAPAGPARADHPPACALLLEGSCAVHAWRPLVCRSYGIPLQFGPLPAAAMESMHCGPGAAAPSLFTWCPDNFSDGRARALLGGVPDRRLKISQVARGGRKGLQRLLFKRQWAWWLVPPRPRSPAPGGRGHRGA